MENHTREQLLKLLENNSRLTNAELAIMLDVTQEQIHDEIASLEKKHIICGYHTLINWDKVNDNDVTALVELHVTPQGGNGYQQLADRIKQYPQVLSFYLMSGAYDFLVMIKGKTLKEISLFAVSLPLLMRYKAQPPISPLPNIKNWALTLTVKNLMKE